MKPWKQVTIFTVTTKFTEELSLNKRRQKSGDYSGICLLKKDKLSVISKFAKHWLLYIKLDM